MLTGVFSHKCLALSPMSHTSFKIASFAAALGQRSSYSICCSDFLTRTASLAMAELPVLWQWDTASGDSKTVTGCVVERWTKGCFCCWLTPGFPFLKTNMLWEVLRKISMIKVWLLWKFVRNIFAARPIIDSILVVLEHTTFSFSPFLLELFSLVSPSAPSVLPCLQISTLQTHFAIYLSWIVSMLHSGVLL